MQQVKVLVVGRQGELDRVKREGVGRQGPKPDTGKCLPAVGVHGDCCK